MLGGGQTQIGPEDHPPQTGVGVALGFGAVQNGGEGRRRSRLALYSRWPTPSCPVSNASNSAGVMERSRARMARSQAAANTGARPAASSAS